MNTICPHCAKVIEQGNQYCPYCHNDIRVQNANNALPVGTILANRYYIGKVLGQGGFGITYVGCDTRLNKKVAIKEYYPAGYVNRLSEHSTNVTVTPGDTAVTFEHEKQKFIKEAYLLAEFSGDYNVVSVTDIISDHNTAYIVMEYVDGQTLEQYLREVKSMSFDSAFSMLEPIMNSLSEVHAKGLIHRDISPANIMVQANRHCVLIDFGAAREYDGAAEKSLSVILKQGYSPTEQYQSRGIQGPWTDVYAICATLYKMITGITPPSAIDRVIGDTLKKPSELGIAISPQMEAVLLKGLAVNQADRYSSIQDLRNGFWGFVVPEKEVVVPEKEEQQPANIEKTVLITPSEERQARENVQTVVTEVTKQLETNEPKKTKKGIRPAFIVIPAAIAAVLAVGGILIFNVHPSETSRNSVSNVSNEQTVAQTGSVNTQNEETLKSAEPVSNEQAVAELDDTVTLVINNDLANYSKNYTSFEGSNKPIVHILATQARTVDIVYTYTPRYQDSKYDEPICKTGIELTAGVYFSQPVPQEFAYWGKIEIEVRDHDTENLLATSIITME